MDSGGDPSGSSPPLNGPNHPIGRLWTLRDIPQAVRLSFDLQKLGTGALGLAAAFLAFGLLEWLGARTGERAAHRVFTALGALVATCLCVLFSGVIARMATTQLLEDRRAGAAELRDFLRRRWSTLAGIPLAFGGFALMMLGMEAMLALIGAIPGIGPLVYSSSFVLAFLLSLTSVLTAAVHMVGAFLYPTIVAIRGVGAIGAILEVIELARRKPFYLIIYEGVVGAVGAVMTLIIGGAVWVSLKLTVFLGESIMQDKFDQTRSAIPGFFHIFLRPFARAFPSPAEEIEAAWHYDVSGVLMGASFMLVLVLTLVYPFVFFTSAGSITYLILRNEPAPVEPSPIEDL